MAFNNKGNSYSDQEIVEGIRAGGSKRQRLTNYLFDHHAGLVYQGIKRYKLKEEDSFDVYSDAIIAVSLQIQSGRFKGNSKISTYLFSIFSNRCKNKIRDLKTNKFTFVDDIPDMPDRARNMLRMLIEKESNQQLLAYLDKLGEKCKQILMLRLFEGYNFEEIAKMIGFKTAQSVSSMKYRCMENLKKLIRNKGKS